MTTFRDEAEKVLLEAFPKIKMVGDEQDVNEKRRLVTLDALTALHEREVRSELEFIGNGNSYDAQDRAIERIGELFYGDKGYLFTMPKENEHRRASGEGEE